MNDAATRPRVVACLPAWNSAEFIAPVLASLAAQTYPNLHVLISVDACADGTGALCDAFAAARPWVRVIHQPRRLGWIANANALLRAADGDYLFFAFHDDPLQPTYVERLVDALDGAPDAVLAFSDVLSADGPLCYPDLDGSADRFERVRRIIVQQGFWWIPIAGLMRASAVARLGTMRRNLAGEYSADLPWLLRLAIIGPFVHVPEPLITKCFRPSSLSARWRKDTLHRLAVVLACIDVLRTATFPLVQTLWLCGIALRFAAGVELWILRHRLRRLFAATRAFVSWAAAKGP
jgi:glycosyltransferase involved in cell wall biosynthesis